MLDVIVSSWGSRTFTNGYKAASFAFIAADTWLAVEIVGSSRQVIVQAGKLEHSTTLALTAKQPERELNLGWVPPSPHTNT